MEKKKFKRLNNIAACVVLAVASFTYLSTIEPTVSFWDCGEFIASSYKLEVGHPPGNPVFQLIARFFTMFGDNMHAAMLINAMSALCSALTIFFLYLTIAHLGRRLLERQSGSRWFESDGQIPLAGAISVIGAAVVGSLAYCWSDTFWFSAVEAEVYAMSSLFTAVVFWAMLKWEDCAEQKYANRWLVLIAFLMGLSIGVHLLNLLTIPALAFIWYFRKKESVSTWNCVKMFIISAVILAAILFGIMPLVPKMAAYVDLFSVNSLGLPFNVGASIFLLALLAAVFWYVFHTYRKGQVARNTIALCVGVLLIGYSTMAVVVIRASANTPTNENHPDNPFTLLRYIGREQYGKTPLLYGQTFASPWVDTKESTYWNVYDGKYLEVPTPVEPVYTPESKMLFPRMFNAGSGDQYVSFYQMYTEGKGTRLADAKHPKPTMGANIKYFLDYQLDFMYMRYFMWNFAGRQNDLQATIPGDPLKGNWESGIGFLDRARLGDQSVGPDYLVNNKAKNHFYMLPLLLGLLGFFFQLKHDSRNWVITMLLFVLTGIAIVLYLNQTPFQPRERDYAYAGSFYAFTIWIGLAVLWLMQLLDKAFKGSNRTVSAALASVLCLLVPLQMVSQTWDDHDRSGRYFVRDLAWNYLNSCDENAMVVTHGDNDTFPLWYSQEVENTRTDIRVLNTSLLGTDWYINQMRFKQYESDPVPFSLDRKQYFYGVNDIVYIIDRFDKPVLLKDIMRIFKSPEAAVRLEDGNTYNYIAAHEFLLPVNKDNVRKYHIVPEQYMDQVPDTIKLSISPGKRYLDKAELMMLDLLSNYNWDRPLYLLQKAGDLNMGIKDYLMYNGMAYKFVPIRHKSDEQDAFMDEDAMYDLVMNKYRFDNFANTELNYDYQHVLSFNTLISYRALHANIAEGLYNAGKTDKAMAVLDRMVERFPAKSLPLNNCAISNVNDKAVLDAICLYLNMNANEKAEKLADGFIEETLLGIDLFSQMARGDFISADGIQQCFVYLTYLQNAFEQYGNASKAKEISDTIERYLAPLKEYYEE